MSRRLPAALAAVERWAGNERLGEPILVSQQRIDQFADATGDANWMHVDPVRAAAALPGGRTIAHGFLLLSLTVADDVVAILGDPGVAIIYNYGLNRVRFLGPVAAGDRVRVRSRMLSLEPRGDDHWLLTQLKTVEQADSAAIVLSAEHITLIVPRDAEAAGA